MVSEIEQLTPRQQSLLHDWLPRAHVVRNHSWGLVGTTVLEITHADKRYIVKAGDADDHHLARELRAHRNWLDPWYERGRAPRLVYADDGAKLIVTRYLPGELAEGSEYEWRTDTYRQAGELLAQLHRQLATEDAEFEAREKAKSLAWLDKQHRIPAEIEMRLRAEVESWPTPPVTVVPTHGDWHPRNWLVHDGVVSAIDFGRADVRPALTDFARLASRQFRADPGLERAFIDGYGCDPRTPDVWRRTRVREAIGTAVWAYVVGDEGFERQGHRMVDEALGLDKG